MSKLKGGKLGLQKHLYNLNKKGGAAVKKLTDDELKAMEQLNLSGGALVRIRSIKPLNFKL